MPKTIPPEFSNLGIALFIAAAIWMAGSRALASMQFSSTSLLGRAVERWGGYGERTQSMIRTGFVMVLIGGLTLFLHSSKSTGASFEVFIALLLISLGTIQIIATRWRGEG